MLAEENIGESGELFLIHQNFIFFTAHNSLKLKYEIT